MYEMVKYYDENAYAYYRKTININMSEQYESFLKYLDSGSKILDFGCGSGRDTIYFKKMGYDVTALDGSKELCALVKDIHGIDVLNMNYKDFNEENKYDGVWACSSLVHLNNYELLEILKKIRKSMKDDGVVYTGMKEYSSEGTIYYNCMNYEEFCELAFESGFRIAEAYRNNNNGNTWSNYILRRK